MGSSQPNVQNKNLFKTQRKNLTVFFAAFCYGCAENLMFSVVGAGLKRPPARKLDFVIGHVENQNYSFHNRRKLFYPRTLLGRARKPAPTGLYGFFVAFRSRKSAQSFGFHKNFLRRF